VAIVILSWLEPENRIRMFAPNLEKAVGGPKIRAAEDR